MSISYKKLYEVFESSINEDGTFKDNVQELIDCLKETFKKSFDPYTQRYVYRLYTCAKFMSHFTSPGIRFSLESKWFLSILAAP